MGPPKAGFGIGSKKPAVVGPQKSLHKSETFFEKVEAAETSTDLPKREPESLTISLFLQIQTLPFVSRVRGKTGGSRDETKKPVWSAYCGRRR